MSTRIFDPVNSVFAFSNFQVIGPDESLELDSDDHSTKTAFGDAGAYKSDAATQCSPTPDSFATTQAVSNSQSLSASSVGANGLPSMTKPASAFKKLSNPLQTPARFQISPITQSNALVEPVRPGADAEGNYRSDYKTIAARALDDAFKDPEDDKLNLGDVDDDDVVHAMAILDRARRAIRQEKNKTLGRAAANEMRPLPRMNARASRLVTQSEVAAPHYPSLRNFRVNIDRDNAQAFGGSKLHRRLYS